MRPPRWRPRELPRLPRPPDVRHADGRQPLRHVRAEEGVRCLQRRGPHRLQRAVGRPGEAWARPQQGHGPRAALHGARHTRLLQRQQAKLRRPRAPAAGRRPGLPVRARQPLHHRVLREQLLRQPRQHGRGPGLRRRHALAGGPAAGRAHGAGVAEARGGLQGPRAAGRGHAHAGPGGTAGGGGHAAAAGQHAGAAAGRALRGAADREAQAEALLGAQQARQARHRDDVRQGPRGGHGLADDRCAAGVGGPHARVGRQGPRPVRAVPQPLPDHI
mmetsp:Transcript_104923/g.296838  ORF Transcript_104923/g.296838 Transcript_104923/m.296838 type:complete len:274 (+) Transcript_104923:345-1166(+)